MQQINPYLSKKPLAVGIKLIAKGFLSSFERIPQNCISESADEWQTEQLSGRYRETGTGTIWKNCGADETGSRNYRTVKGR